MFLTLPIGSLEATAGDRLSEGVIKACHEHPRAPHERDYCSHFIAISISRHPRG